MAAEVLSLATEKCYRMLVGAEWEQYLRISTVEPGHRDFYEPDNGGRRTESLEGTEYQEK